MRSGNPNPVPALGNLKPAKPGEVRNPHGRAPEKVIKEFCECNDLERLKKLAEEVYKSAIGEDVEEVTETELPDGKVTRQVKRYREKSVAAFKALMERGYGMPKQEVEVSTNLTVAISELLAQKNVTPPIDVQPITDRNAEVLS